MKRSPAAAFWLSVLPGLGHLYLGQVTKGFVLALIAAGLIDFVNRGAEAFGILIPIYWIFVMIDAHRSSQAVNRDIEAGRPVGDPMSGAGSKWWGGALIGLGALFLLYNLEIIDFDWLWRFWPVALIALGIRMIWQPAVARPSVPASTPMPPEAPAAGESNSARPAGEAGESALHESSKEESFS